MATVSVRTRKKTQIKLDSADVQNLQMSLRGKLLQQGDAGYDEARSIWNGMVDRKPTLIVQPMGVADVQRAVKFAMDHDLFIAIKGGGHNIAGSAVCDDGLMLDMSRMRAVRIDPEARVAHVGAGATLGDFDHEAQNFGLATPLGINSTTGVAGLTLGGGFGWLTRKYGMTVDNLLAADVVTADGKFITTSDSKHPDLFWALRGGGGNFGVVTRFEFKLHPVGPNVLTGLVVYPLSQGVQVLKKYRDFMKTLPTDSNVWMVTRQAPPLPFIPADKHGTPVVVFAMFHAGDPEQGRKNLEPVRTWGDKIGEFIGEQPFVSWQKAFDPLLTPGARNYWKSHNFTELSDKLIETVVENEAKAPRPDCETFFGYIGGAANKIPKYATAYAHRDAIVAMNVHGRWHSADDDNAGIKWARDVFRATAPHASGNVYVNFLTDDEKDRIREAYGGNYDRLVEVKRMYDPKNLFCMNQNIDPTV